MSGRSATSSPIANACCSVCKSEVSQSLQRCARCRNPDYLVCSVACQKSDWKRHKKEECGSLKAELLGTGQESLIPNLCENTNSALITRVKSEAPPRSLVKQARKMFGPEADKCFIHDLARLASVCQHLLREHGGNANEIKIMVDVGTKPNATLDPYVLTVIKTKMRAGSSDVVGFYVHRIGSREKHLKESVVLIECLVEFIQSATKQYTVNDEKLKIYLLSCGGHDSDCVVKEIFDKPNALRDLVRSTPYFLLSGNISHYSCMCIPWPVLLQEGFYCMECAEKQYFCGLESSLYESSLAEHS